MRDFGKVAVLFGGRSQERAVSLKSGEAVLRALQAEGVDAHPFDPAEQPLQALKEQNFERVFIALHGRGGEDGQVQGALDWLGLPYTGSRVLGSALAMDKVRTKQIWQALGLPTAAYRVVQHALNEQEAQAMLDELGGQVIVKPACEGSSIGMAKATTSLELEEAISDALSFDDEVLVESWIQGEEYTVAILGESVLPPIRMQTPHVFYDYSAKYKSTSTQYFCPCGLDEVEDEALKTLAYQAFVALDATGWGRVDAMRDSDGNWYLLEVNTVPGMTEKSLVPMAAKAQGLTFGQVVVEILAAASL